MDIGRDVGERVWESSFCRQLLFGSNVVEYYFCVETFIGLPLLRTEGHVTRNADKRPNSTMERYFSAGHHQCQASVISVIMFDRRLFGRSGRNP
jgi:hypothetical protein